MTPELIVKLLAYSDGAFVVPDELLKEAAEEMARLIGETQRLRFENERLRTLLVNTPTEHINTLREGKT